MTETLAIKSEPGSVLGLNYNGGHDSSVSIVAPDGRVTFACSLERVSRHKQDGRFPRALLDLVDFSYIAACALPCYSPENVPSGPTGERFHSVRHSEQDYIIHQYPSRFYGELRSLPIPKVFVGHELSHAASAYYLSQFSDAAIVAYDAGMYNEPWFGGVFRGNGPTLEPIEYFPSRTNAKVASLYAIVTGLLGFKPLRHEGKLTGLAAYTKPDPDCIRLLEQLLTERYHELESVARWINPFDPNEPPQFSVDTEARSQVLARFGGASPAAIASSLQYVTEQHVLDIVQRVKDEAISDRLCLAGGLFANVRLNQRIHEIWGGSVFIAPPMGDDGAGLGAALQHAFQSGAAAFPMAKSTMYVGFSYPEEDVWQTLERYGIQYDQTNEPAAAVATLLAKGKTVAVFSGAMEFGPRALGHRSILAPAIDRGITEVLNRKLRRSEFMPFAPISRAEDAERLYRGTTGAEHAGEFMTITFDATPELASSCPAVVHVDGTVRPQIVTSTANPLLHALLTEYQRLTGVSSVINTSFNIHEEPIVCSPDDAIRGFFEAKLDYLYIDGFLISLERNVGFLATDTLEQFPASTRAAREEPVLVDYLWRELHYLRRQAEERLSLVQHLHADCEQYREHIDSLQAQIDAFRAEKLEQSESSSEDSGEATTSEVEANSRALMPAGNLPLERAEPRLEVEVIDDRSGDVPVVLVALARLESRVNELLDQRALRLDSDANLLDRLATLEQARTLAEDAAAARLRVIEEQQRALEHYRYWQLTARIRRVFEPRIGVLYQYPPRPLEIPGHYYSITSKAATPTISLVTATYNQGRFIERTVRSVLEQNYQQLEYVVQDGASGDETLDVLERFGDSIAHLDSRRDEGLANALNLGFARSTGDVMAYLNSDDLLMPGSLHYVANFFERHPSVDVVYGQRVVIDEYDAEIGRWVLPPHENGVLSWADYVPQETLFWRRRAWESIGSSLDESFRFAVDWDLLLRFRAAGARMVRLPRFLGAFRVHPHQKTSAEMADVGTLEMRRLRERVHGRSVKDDEIHQALRPYLRKHVLYHKLYRLGFLRY